MQSKKIEIIQKHHKDIWTDENLKSNEKLVLIYLIDYYNEKLEYSYPTREQIHKGTGISLKTLNIILNSLVKKGYITIGKHKNDKGWNNIYKIHKYLVVYKFENKSDNKTVSEPQREVSENQSTNNSTDNIKPLTNENTEPINQELELTANEQLLYREGIQKLNSEQKELLNKLDTDRLIKTIEIAKQNTNNLNFNYLIKIYNNNFKKKTAPKTTEEPRKDNNGKAVKGAYQQVFTGDKKTGDKKDYVNNNYPVKTKYHNTFNEHFRNYSEEELEKKLHRMKNKKALDKALKELEEIEKDKELNEVQKDKANEKNNVNNVGGTSNILKNFDISNSSLPQHILEQMKLYQGN